MPAPTNAAPTVGGSSKGKKHSGKGGCGGKPSNHAGVDQGKPTRSRLSSKLKNSKSC